jgi:hypothetical protein
MAPSHRESDLNNNNIIIIVVYSTSLLGAQNHHDVKFWSTEPLKCVDDTEIKVKGRGVIMIAAGFTHD